MGVDARRSVRHALIKSNLGRSGCAHQVRQQQAPPETPSDSAAKIVMTEEQPATVVDRTGLEETPGARRSALERILRRASSCVNHATGVSRPPPTRHDSIFASWKMRYSWMLHLRLEVTQAESAAVLARGRTRRSAKTVVRTNCLAALTASTGHHRASTKEMLPRQLGQQLRLQHPMLSRH